MHLVTADHQIVDSELLDVDRDLPQRLNGVTQHRHSPAPTKRCHLPHRLDRTQLVVGGHQGNEPGLGTQGSLDGSRVDAAVGSGGDLRHRDRAVPPASGFGRFPNRRVLEGVGHQVGTRLGSRGHDHRVRLTARGDEDHLARIGSGLADRSADRGDDLLSSPIDRLPGTPPGGVRGGWVAVHAVEPGQHDLPDPAIERCGRVVVEINQRSSPRSAAVRRTSFHRPARRRAVTVTHAPRTSPREEGPGIRP